MVEAGYFARLMREPACAMSFAPTSSPTIVVRFGAIAYILFFKYSLRVSLYADNSMI